MISFIHTPSQRSLHFISSPAPCTPHFLVPLFLLLSTLAYPISSFSPLSFILAPSPCLSSNGLGSNYYPATAILPSILSFSSTTPSRPFVQQCLSTSNIHRRAITKIFLPYTSTRAFLSRTSIGRPLRYV
ncbi:MAG: hypothetical protein J3R72DRAFT_436605 [Linnemannia gamsii]|nr:MAG: hypothetical protein J3R72DRAFT_436605 [Linnemannia gamsii]